MNKKMLTGCIAFALFAQIASAQDKVTGHVVSADDGQPIVGASVVVKGTKIGTVTNLDGSFTLNAKDAKTLRISYLGMEPVEVAAGENVKVTLKPNAKALDEVLVVAYGNIKKSAFTGSAAVVNADELKTPAASFDKALAGQVAGVQIVSNSGQPGSTTSFRIRGAGSLKASNEPLYVIDGVAVSSYSDQDVSEIAYGNDSGSNILATINPNDIESVTVLKDAAAAALYGSRAANGVVMITTKSGKGRAKVNFNAQFSWANMPKGYDMESSADYYKQYFLGYLAKGQTVEEANKSTQGAITHNPYNVANPLDANGNLVSGARLVVDTDWQKEVYKTAPSKDYNLSVGGKSNSTDYFFSLGYTDQEGVAPASAYRRYTGKINVNTQANSWLKAGMNATFSHAIQNTTVAGSAGASPLFNALQFPNGVPVYVVDANGNPVLDESGNKQYNFSNPVSRDFNPLAIPYMDVSRSKLYRLLAAAYGDVKLYEGLHFKTVLSADFLTTDEHSYWNKEHGNGPSYNGRIDKYHHTDLAYTSTNTLSYSTLINKVHSLNVLAGMEYWKSHFETLYAGGKNILGNLQELSAASGTFLPSSVTTREVLISYFGRAEYSFDNKYNVSASLRTDGSSLFGEDNKWGTFYSLGGAWNMKQEKFLANVGWVDNLKLRLSYGTSGNKNGLTRYASLGLWTVGGDYAYGPNAGVAHKQLENKKLSWEKQKMFNIGVDFSFLGRLHGSVDYFSKVSDGLLYDYPLALSTGFKNITMNAAKLSNSGFEFTIGANILTGEFKWNADLNASVIKDKIKDLNGDNDVQVTSYKKIWSIGGSQYEFYMPTWAGVDPQNGDPLWYKVDDKGNRTKTNVYAQATYERQGRSTPDVFGGFLNTFSWKNLTLSIQINYTIGGKIFDGLYQTIMNDGSRQGTNLHKDALNAWTTPGQVTDVPKFAISNSSGSSNMSSRFLYDATNFKLKNITLSYTLPSKLGFVSRFLTSARVWVSADNLYTIFTDKGYKGFDDIDIFGVQGYSAYPSIPIPRTFSLGFNLTF